MNINEGIASDYPITLGNLQCRPIKLLTQPNDQTKEQTNELTFLFYRNIQDYKGIAAQFRLRGLIVGLTSILGISRSLTLQLFGELELALICHPLRNVFRIAWQVS